MWSNHPPSLSKTVFHTIPKLTYCLVFAERPASCWTAVEIVCWCRPLKSSCKCIKHGTWSKWALWCFQVLHHVLPTKIPMIDFIQLVPQNNNQKNKLRHQSGTTLIRRGLCQYTCLAQCCRKLAGGHYCGELPCPKSHCSIHFVQPPVCSTLRFSLKCAKWNC